MAMIKINRSVTTDELLEIVRLMENQETTDKYVNTSIHINGDNAVIDVEIDNDGDVILL